MTDREVDHGRQRKVEGIREDMRTSMMREEDIEEEGADQGRDHMKGIIGVKETTGEGEKCIVLF